MTDRPWIQTASGRVFPLIDPSPEDVHWPDVVYALSHANRFAGHAGPYSVAQHTMEAIRLADMPNDWKPYWFLHDAHEFAIGDITRPTQRALEYGTSGASGAVRLLKDGIDRALYKAAGLEWPVPSEIREGIHVIDARMLMTEARDLLRPPPMSWGYESFRPYEGRIMLRWTPEQSYYLMALGLHAYFDLTLP